MIEDRRTIDQRPLFYVVATDSSLSGWGLAPGRSYFALAAYTEADADNIRRIMHTRPELKRVRTVTTLRADGIPKMRIRSGDHLSVRDYTTAKVFYPHRA